MDSLELLGTGRTADVYAIDGDLVLRRYREDWDTDAEASVMAYVAAHGYPVPRVETVSGPDMVMQRIAGRTILDVLTSGGDGDPLHGTAPLDAVGILAGLLSRLHGIPGRVPGTSVIHLDLHFGNIILSPDGPVVIDWSNAADGPAGLDVAMSAFIIAEVAADEAHPMAALAAEAVTGLIALTGAPAPEHVDRVLTMRTANPTLPAIEKARLPEAAAIVKRAGRAR